MNLALQNATTHQTGFRNGSSLVPKILATSLDPIQGMSLPLPHCTLGGHGYHGANFHALLLLSCFVKYLPQAAALPLQVLTRSFAGGGKLAAEAGICSRRHAHHVLRRLVKNGLGYLVFIFWEQLDQLTKVLSSEHK